MKLLFGTSEIGGSDNPCPSVSISADTNYHPVTGKPSSCVYSWKVRGVLLNKGTALSTQKSSLEGIFTGRVGTEVIKLDNGGTEVNSLDGSNCLDGLQVSEISYPEGSGVEYATKLTYEFEVTGEVVIDDSQWADYTERIAINKQGLETLSINGTYYTPAISESLKDDCQDWVEANLKPSGNYEWNLEIGKEASSDGGTVRRCDFTARFGEVLFKPTENVVESRIQSSVRTTAQDYNTLTLSGSLKGKKTEGTEPLDNARSAYQAVINSPASYCSSPDVNSWNTQHLLSASVNEDVSTGTLSFTVSFLMVNVELVRFEETMEITAAYYDYVMQPVLDGRNPVKQWTVVKPAKAMQTGQKIVRQRQSPPQPYWANPKNPVTRISAIKRDSNGNAQYWRIEWSYEWEFERTPVL